MSKTALILIDWQVGFDEDFWGPRNNPGAEAAAAALIEGCRARSIPVWHVHHHSRETNPLAADGPGTQPQPFAAPQEGEPAYRKSVNSGFIGTTLEADLREAGITDLIISGVTTDHCVSTTTRMAANLGFRVRLVGEACYCHDRTAPNGQIVLAEAVHQAHLASLHQEFAIVVRVSDVLSA